MESKNINPTKPTSYLFWGVSIAACTAIIGCTFYALKSLIYDESSNGEELTDEEKSKLEKIREDKEENSHLTEDLAIQIMAFINKKSDEIFLKSMPDVDNRRRKFIEDPEEYEKICKEMFDYKEWIFNQTTEKILKQTDFDSLGDIQKILQNKSPFEIEKKAYEYYYPNYEGKEMPGRKCVKEAFLYYGKKFKLEMKEINEIINKRNDCFDEEQNNLIFFRLLVLKVKVEDKLFIKFGYTEAEIRFLLFKYDLFNDKDVAKVHNEISKFDEIISPAE
jgi:hypothetical protein